MLRYRFGAIQEALELIGNVMKKYNRSYNSLYFNMKTHAKESSEIILILILLWGYRVWVRG